MRKLFIAICLLMSASALSKDVAQAPVVDNSVHQQIATSDPENSGNRHGGDANNPVFVELTPSENDKSERSDRAEEGKKHLANENAGVIINGLIAIFTFAIAVFTICLYFTARHTMKTQLRAYVGVDKCSMDPTHQSGWNIMPSYEIEIRNFGQTPAHNVVHLHAMVTAPVELVGDPTASLSNRISHASKTVIWPGSGAKAEKTPEISLTSDQHSEIGDGRLALYVLGAITYTDIFGRSHTTKYVYEKSIRADNLHTQNLAPYDKYNHAD